MRENCTYGSMRGRAFPTGRPALLYTLLFPSGGIIGSSAFVEELTRRERVAFPRERKSSPQEVCVGGLKLFALRHLKAFRK